ncbi:MAG: methyltransferase [Nautilia sp.]|nr:MAG: methyltransferase [Nautilia sp.]
MILHQPKNGYCYNSDTLFLYDFISNFPIKKNVLEVGGGCGVLGLLLARDFKINLTIIEIQKIMSNFIEKNSKINGIEVELINDNFLKYQFNKRFDYIVSNPPFYNSTKQSDNEIIKIARYDENLPMKEFFEKVNSILTEQGEFIFCYEASRFDDIVKILPKPLKVIDVKFVYPKKGKFANLVMIRAKRHAKSMVKFHTPIFNFDGSDFSEDAKKVYKKANTKSVKE